MQHKTFWKFKENLHYIVNDKLGDVSTPIHDYITQACNVIKYLKFEDLFMKEWCARSVHDAHEGGLADHTVKVFTELINMLYAGDADSRYYDNIINSVDLQALIIGCILHDIGKITEYDKGKDSKEWFLPHTLSGVVLLAESIEYLRDIGVEDKTTFRIFSIIGQHHGDFGEKPKTVEAYLVHLADYQETKLQILSECITACREEDTDSNAVVGKYLPYKMSFVK